MVSLDRETASCDSCTMLGVPRVLVVGSSISAAENLVPLLDAFGYATDCVDPAVLVPDKLRDAGYCCLVAALEPNDVTALDALVQLRTAGMCVPAVLITPLLSSQDRERVDELGAEVVVAGAPPINWVWKLANALQRSTRHESGFIRRLAPDDEDDVDRSKATRGK